MYTPAHVMAQARRRAVARSRKRARRAPARGRGALAAPGRVAADAGRLVGRRGDRPPHDRRDRDRQADDQAHQRGRAHGLPGRPHRVRRAARVGLRGGRRARERVADPRQAADRAGDPRGRPRDGRPDAARRRRDRAAPGDVGRRAMKCRKCGGAAALELRRHNAAFCAPDFLEFFRNQVREAIRRHKMFTRDERVLVAVSGGKDSLALWDVLLDEGYDATGLYLDLGIFDYSVESKAKCEAFAARRGVPLIITRVADEVGGPVPVIKQVTRRPPCSGCGLSKRYLMNRAALEHGMAVVATGHNLDDEAATLFGSVMHWQTDALPRQSPALASTHPKLVRRVKPLYRLSEREAAAYAVPRRIDYIVEECPFAKAATSIAPKEILSRMEEASPGAKHNFLFGFLEKARPAFERAEAVQLNECARCGQVTTGTVCAFCKLADQVKRAAADVPPAREQ